MTIDNCLERDEGKHSNPLKDINMNYMRKKKEERINFCFNIGCCSGRSLLVVDSAAAAGVGQTDNLQGHNRSSMAHVVGYLQPEGMDCLQKLELMNLNIVKNCYKC